MTAVTAPDRTAGPDRVDSPAWTPCRRCRCLLYVKRFARELSVCAECGWHGPLTAGERIAQLLDPGEHPPIPGRAVQVDPLAFTDTRSYADRLEEARARTGLDEAVVCVRGALTGLPLVLAVMDFRFMGGSLGSGVGERLAAAAEVALRERCPFVMVTASGGARMQEGVLSLLQMVKTTQALAELDEAGVLTVAVVADPTYGGVAASFASVADVVLAEPGARLGFAGPRVIAQTLGRPLPDGFQSAEFLLAHGLVDDVVPRARLRATLAKLLRCDRPSAAVAAQPAPELVTDPDALPVRPAWEVVQMARRPDRPTSLDYLSHLVDGFCELHGDRASADCPAVVGGIGLLEGSPVVAIGSQKGHTTQELVARNFGMPLPAGYRKAARLMRLAAKLGVPVVTLIDTPGAYPGPEAEERGQAVAIAENLRLMSALPVPIVAVVTGEGGSGGALALAVADRVLVLEHATYSVISPEGCAAILWQSTAAAPQAAAALNLTAPQLLRLGVVDGVVPEPDGGAHRDHGLVAARLGRAVTAALAELRGVTPGDLVATRRARFRRVGLAAAEVGRGG